MASPDPTGSEDTAAGGRQDDPIVSVLREHTELQVMAERFRQIADALERSEPTARADAAEAVEVHRRFLILVHQRREAILAAELRASVDPSVRPAFARCASEHPLADRFQAEAGELLVERPVSADGARRLAALFRAEADRVVEHHRWETESIYSKIRGTLPAETIHRLQVAMEPLVGEAGAAQARLMSWSSHANPAAD